MKFKDLKLSSTIIDAIDSMGFEEATPVQSLSIPLILEGKDIISVAQTGTGKTAAFVIPILDKITGENCNTINTLILSPTRELAIQIDQQIMGLAYFTDVSSAAVYGGGEGSDFEKEKNALREGTNIIVATPGRLMTHINLGHINFSNIKHFVLDEADRMLDMGFQEDIVKIAGNLPKNRQNIMFSATMPPKIRAFAKRIMNENPEEINIAISKPAEGVLQAAYLVYDSQKLDLIKSLLLGKDHINSVILFSSRKSTVKEVNHLLKKAGLLSGAIHSELEQNEREEVLRDFRNHKLKILVATDVIARGIDIDNIELVINYEVPDDPEDYIHRIGRTARASSTGVGITFINDHDQYKFKRIEDLIEQEINKLHLPPDFEPGPEYNPLAKRQGNHFRHKKRRH